MAALNAGVAIPEPTCAHIGGGAQSGSSTRGRPQRHLRWSHPYTQSALNSVPRPRGKRAEGSHHWFLEVAVFRPPQPRMSRSRSRPDRGALQAALGGLRLLPPPACVAAR